MAFEYLLKCDDRLAELFEHGRRCSQKSDLYKDEQLQMQQPGVELRAVGFDVAQAFQGLYALRAGGCAQTYLIREFGMGDSAVGLQLFQDFHVNTIQGLALFSRGFFH